MLVQVSDLDDPNRCQVNNKHGQCRYLKTPGLDTCEAHGSMQIAKQKREVLSNYRLLKYQDRLLEKKNSPEVKTLREEIAILRMTLEEIMIAAEQVEGGQGLFLYSSRIVGVVDSVTKTIQACHAMEEKVGAVLDKSKVLMIADSITTVISRYVSPEILGKINDEIARNIESICLQELTAAA